MKKKIEVLDKTLYEQEVENNEAVFKNALKQLRPDVYVLMDLLDATQVNYYVVFKIIRHLNNIAISSNPWGKIVVEIENGKVSFIRGEESDRLNEEIIVGKKK
jgi:hypothetical protein